MKNKNQNKFFYLIDLDERGCFQAHIEDENGKEIFSFSNESDEEDFEGGLWIVDFGYMKHTEDINGLKSYLVQMEILDESDILLKGNF